MTTKQERWTWKEFQDFENVIATALEEHPAGSCPRREESRRVAWAICKKYRVEDLTNE